MRGMKNSKQRSPLYVVIVAAIGGFLFGFDSGVISGCDKAIQAEFGLSAIWHGLIIAGALIGTVIGVFTAGAPSDRWGRKKTLWLMGALFLVSAIGCAFTVTNKVVGPHMLGWFRFIGGLAIGGVSVVVPLYIVEVSPGPLRGRLVATNQLNIVFGILISYVSNYFVASWMSVDGGWFHRLCQWLADAFASSPMTTEMVKWRVMLGMECLPIILFMALLVTIPESPRWLVRVGRKEEAEGVLTSVGYPDVPKTMVEIEESLREAQGAVSVPLFQRKYLKPILLAFFIAFFNQVSGINAINYYAPRIFDMIFGEGSEMASLAGTMGVGAVNLTFTILAFFIIDKFGRRVMIIGGASLMILMHSLVAWQLSLNDSEVTKNAEEAAEGISAAVTDGGCEFFSKVTRSCDLSDLNDKDEEIRAVEARTRVKTFCEDLMKDARKDLECYLNANVISNTAGVVARDLPMQGERGRFDVAFDDFRNASENDMTRLVRGIKKCRGWETAEEELEKSIKKGEKLSSIPITVAVGTTTKTCNTTLAVLGILGFIAFFACSSGAVIWVYISEVFPNAVRAKGQALGCFTHWFMCTIISWAFPVVAASAGTWAFGFFAFMMLVQVIWAVFFMPETKGGTTEDIEARLGIEN